MMKVSTLKGYPAASEPTPERLPALRYEESPIPRGAPLGDSPGIHRPRPATAVDSLDRSTP